MQPYQSYMQRCLQLAKLGGSMVAPNPMVGAVLVYENRIIGEGYHQQYGFAHAEVNCLNSVAEEDKQHIEQSTLYVSLEPCAHHGKTPPCADLIIKHAIKKVVVGCRDPFEAVNGKGIEKLLAAGVEVIVGVIEDACIALNERFFTAVTKQRPYVVLKWAQSHNNIMGGLGEERLLISNEFSNRLVHKWRSEEQAIMVGTNTALQDDPQLNNRLWAGRNPLRIVLDLNLRLPQTLKVFDGSQPTVIINYNKQEVNEQVQFVKLERNAPLIPAIMAGCAQLNIQSILVEGGRQLLQTLIDSGIWDEARVIENTQMIVDAGVAAPTLRYHRVTAQSQHFNDSITCYRPAH